jgi:hypothetical protein
LGTEDVRLTAATAQHLLLAGSRVLVVDRASFDARPFFESLGSGITVLRVDAKQQAHRALNEAWWFADGEIITYAVPGTQWPKDHLLHMRTLFQERAVTSAFFRVRSRGSDLSTSTLFDRAKMPQVGISDIVPIEAIAHRKDLLDLFSGIDPRFGCLYRAALSAHIVVTSKVAIDDNIALESVMDTSAASEALLRPQDYLQQIRQFYSAYGVNESLQAKRQQHLAAVTAALNAELSKPSGHDLLRLEMAIRGLTTSA